MSQQYPPSGGGGWGPPQGGAPDPSQQPQGQAHPGQAYPGQAQSGQQYPGQAQSGQAQSGQQYPGQAYPGQPQPGQPFPGQAQPAQAAMAPGYQPSIGPKKPGFLHALSAPPGPVRVLWAGVVLMLVSFMAKQILVDLTVQPLSLQLERERLQSKQAAALGEINTALDKVENEIASLKEEGKSGPENDGSASPVEASGEGAAPEGADAVAEAAKLKEKADKLEKLGADEAAIEKTLRPKRKKVRDEFRPKLTEAARDNTVAEASVLGRFQTSLTIKLLVDLLKLIGASLVVFSALRISTDPEQNSGTKAYAAVLGGIAFVSMAIGGIYAALLG